MVKPHFCIFSIGFNQIKDKQGDALYIRVGFDRNCDLGEHGE